MTEITDLSVTDSSNTSVTGESLDGSIANMGRMDNTLQAVMGLLARSIRTNVMRILDNTDDTKEVAFDASALTTATTRTLTVPNQSGTIATTAASTTDNAVTRFDGTSGQLQNSQVTIGDDGSIVATALDGGASLGPSIDLYRNSPSPAANDEIGGVLFNGKDSAANKQLYAAISAQILSAASGSENARIHFQTVNAGAVANRLILEASPYAFGTWNFDTLVQVGQYSATGVTGGMLLVGDNGTGSANMRTSTNSVGVQNHAQFSNPNGTVGTITTTGSATAYNVSSDAFLKENKRSFDSGEIIDGITAWLFDWKAGGTGYGVMAQDAYQVFPDAVTKGDEPEKYGSPEYRPWAVDYSKFVPVLLREVQDLRKRLKDAGIE